MKKNLVYDELKKRLDREDGKYAVIGIEIKNKRTKISKTLGSLADDTCSVSYLSKIENNKIEPNQQFVRELCQKLDLSKESIDTLINSKNVLMEALRAFLYSSTKDLLSCVDKCNSLDNYRSLLIKLLYALNTKDVYEASNYYQALLGLCTSMTDFDLMVFSLASGILHFYNQEFSEALDNLLVLRDCLVNYEMEILRDQYIFRCYMALNKLDCVYEYEAISDKLSKNGEYELLDYENYLMAIYYAKNGCEVMFNRIYKLLFNKLYKKSAIFMFKFFNSSNKKEYLSISDSKLSTFCNLIKDINANGIEAAERVEEGASGAFSPDNNPLILRYLLIDGAEEKFEFITEAALPIIYRTKQAFDARYFLNELQEQCYALGRYKSFVDAYSKLRKDDLI